MHRVGAWRAKWHNVLLQTFTIGSARIVLAFYFLLFKILCDQVVRALQTLHTLCLDVMCSVLLDG